MCSLDSSTNFLSAFIAVLNSSANFSCSWSCQVSLERAEARLEQHQPVFEVGVEPLQLVREPPDLFRIHDCLCHDVTFR